MPSIPVSHLPVPVLTGILANTPPPPPDATLPPQPVSAAAPPINPVQERARQLARLKLQMPNHHWLAMSNANFNPEERRAYVAQTVANLANRKPKPDEPERTPEVILTDIESFLKTQAHVGLNFSLIENMDLHLKILELAATIPMQSLDLQAESKMTFRKSLPDIVETIIRTSPALDDIRLNLTDVRLRPEQLRKIATALSGVTATARLEFYGNHVKEMDDVLILLTRALKVQALGISILKKLDKEFLVFNDTDATKLADVLRTDRHLEYLDFSANAIGDSGATAIAQAIQANPESALTTVKLYGVDMQNDGAKAWAALLATNTKLTHAILWGNKITDDGARALVNAIKKNAASAIRELDLSGKALTPELKNELRQDSRFIVDRD